MSDTSAAKKDKAWRLEFWYTPLPNHGMTFEPRWAAVFLPSAKSYRMHLEDALERLKEYVDSAHVFAKDLNLPPEQATIHRIYNIRTKEVIMGDIL